MKTYYWSITPTTVVHLNALCDKPARLKERFGRLYPYIEDNSLIRELKLTDKTLFEKDVLKLRDAGIISADLVSDYLDCFNEDEAEAILEYINGTFMGCELDLHKLLIAIRYNSGWVKTEEVTEDDTVFIESNGSGESFIWNC